MRVSLQLVLIGFLLLAGFMPVSGQGGEYCEGCLQEYWGGWEHHFDFEEPPPLLSYCYGYSESACSKCHESSFSGQCIQWHDYCPGPDLDLDALVASTVEGATGQDFQRFLSEHEENLTYDESIEAIRVTQCDRTLLALIPMAPETYRALLDR
jgi:hypothetical protein